MSKLTDGERLVALETKMDIVLDTQNKMNDKLDKLLPTYATKADLEKMKRRNTWIVWATGSLSAAFGVLLTFLITFFLQNIGGK